MTTRLSTLASEKVLVPRDSLTEAEKWRYVMDNTLRLGSLGFLCGAAFSLVVFRSVSTRMAVTAFGSGFGLGKSYVDTRYVLGHDVAAETVWTAEVVKKQPTGTTANTGGVSEGDSGSAQ
ncbi:uncharacterized protein TM35_000122150 [Trypanosoma theileri]|uniref:MICOS complex subunit MIC10 n=1 Tax=Trypanosoma theileri TaxID=67003 RepID=A0A1X0NZ69_9TRYP|nr:uncharacterized protein TM35_000122150 [Trypanosoma theileri]ORC89440.1 hypothetical protein TM35_000122150 [Trypanosoma theileri]